MLTDEDARANSHKIGHTAVIPELARNTPPSSDGPTTLLLNDGEPIEMTIDFALATEDPTVAKLMREIHELEQMVDADEKGRGHREAKISDLKRELARYLTPAEDEDAEVSEPSDFNAQVVERMANDTGRPKDEIAKELLPGSFGLGGAMYVDDGKPGEDTGIFEPKVTPPGFKENNPKDAFGVAKAGLTSYLYGPVLLEMSIGMAAGAYKYGAHNYLCVAPRSSVYTDAAIRHILAYVGGEDFDPEAGEGMKVSHITAAMNSLHVLRAAQINESFVDDRPPPMPANFLSRVNDQMKVLAKLVPDPVARYLAGGRRGPGRIL